MAPRRVRSRAASRALGLSIVATLGVGGAAAVGLAPASPGHSTPVVHATGDKVEATAARLHGGIEVDLGRSTTASTPTGGSPEMPSTTAQRSTTTRPATTTTTTAAPPAITTTLPGVLTPGVYVLRPDGSGLARVSAVPGRFSWSPDGRSIVVVREGALVVVAADGSAERVVTTAGTGVYGPVWSPDGSRIAFGKNGGLSVVAADGSGTATVVDPGARYPSWTPDSRLSAARSDGELVVYDGDMARVLTGDDFGAVAPEWSPDGRMVAYMSNRVMVVGADGTGGRALTEVCCASEYVGSPMAWSPDGRSLAVIDAANVRTVAVDGSPLATLPAASVPAWSPDGGRLAFIDQRTALVGGQVAMEVGVANADGSNRRIVLPLPPTLTAMAVSWNRAVDRLAVLVSARVALPPGG